jgi:hypothetical protein
VPYNPSNPGWPPVFYHDFTSRVWITYRGNLREPIRDGELAELSEPTAWWDLWAETRERERREEEERRRRKEEEDRERVRRRTSEDSENSTSASEVILVSRSSSSHLSSLMSLPSSSPSIATTREDNGTASDEEPSIADSTYTAPDEALLFNIEFDINGYRVIIAVDFSFEKWSLLSGKNGQMQSLSNIQLDFTSRPLYSSSRTILVHHSRPHRRGHHRRIDGLFC